MTHNKDVHRPKLRRQWQKEMNLPLTEFLYYEPGTKKEETPEYRAYLKKMKGWREELDNEKHRFRRLARLLREHHKHHIPNQEIQFKTKCPACNLKPVACVSKDKDGAFYLYCPICACVLFGTIAIFKFIKRECYPHRIEPGRLDVYQVGNLIADIL